MRTDPTRYLWWLVSRASGIIAVTLISLSVLIGLAMAAKLLPRTGLKRTILRLHEYIAVIALVAIAVHGLALLGDQWLKPSLPGITVPFVLSYRPEFTGLGIIAGYLAVLLGPSFYLRRRIGARTWRKLHRATVVVWILAVVHALGAGTDGSKPWLQAIVLVPSVPIVYLLILRLLPRRTSGAKRSPGPVADRRAVVHHSGRTHPPAERHEQLAIASRRVVDEAPLDAREAQFRGLGPPVSGTADSPLRSSRATNSRPSRFSIQS